jgi:hypothetical protein
MLCYEVGADDIGKEEDLYISDTCINRGICLVDTYDGYTICKSVWRGGCTLCPQLGTRFRYPSTLEE